MTNAILILMIADHFLKIGYPVPLYEIVSKTKKNCAHLDIFLLLFIPQNCASRNKKTFVSVCGPEYTYTTTYMYTV